MSAIDDLIAAWTAAFPRYVNAGIASSGPGKPNKLLVMELGQKIADAINAASGGDGTLAYATVADMNADLDHDANTQAAVYADPGGDTTSHNGIWTKVGGTGTGSWSWLRSLSLVELSLRLDALEAIGAEGRLSALEDNIDTNAPFLLAYRREMTERPGDAPELFSDSYTGIPDSSAATALNPVTAANGKVLQLVGAHIIARRGWVRIEPSRKYLVRAVMQRATDPIDPLNDAVQLKMAWFTNAGAAVSGTPVSVLGTFSALTVVSGRQERQVIVGLASGDDITVVAPATTIYARPFVQSFGSDGVSNVEVLEVSDVTDAIGDAIAESLVNDAIAAAASVASIETIVSGLKDDAEAAAIAAAASVGATLAFDNYAALDSSSATPFLEGRIVVLRGGNTKGDDGGGLFRLTQTVPSYVDGGIVRELTTATGWYAIRQIDGPINAMAWSLPLTSDGSTDGQSALQAMADALPQFGNPKVFFDFRGKKLGVASPVVLSAMPRFEFSPGTTFVNLFSKVTYTQGTPVAAFMAGFDASGAITGRSSATTLSATGKRGARKFDVTDASVLSVDQWIVIGDDASVFSPGTPARVVSKSGSTIEIDRPLAVDYVAGGSPSYNPPVWSLTMAGPIEFSGAHWEGNGVGTLNDSGATGDSSPRYGGLLRVYGAIGGHVGGLSAEKFASKIVEMRACCDMRIGVIAGRDATDMTPGEGYVCRLSACYNVKALDLFGSRVRHTGDNNAGAFCEVGGHASANYGVAFLTHQDNSTNILLGPGLITGSDTGAFSATYGSGPGNGSGGGDVNVYTRGLIVQDANLIRTADNVSDQRSIIIDGVHQIMTGNFFTQAGNIVAIAQGGCSGKVVKRNGSVRLLSNSTNVPRVIGNPVSGGTIEHVFENERIEIPTNSDLFFISDATATVTIRFRRCVLDIDEVTGTIGSISNTPVVNVEFEDCDLLIAGRSASNSPLFTGISSLSIRGGKIVGKSGTFYELCTIPSGGNMYVGGGCRLENINGLITSGSAGTLTLGHIEFDSNTFINTPPTVISSDGAEVTARMAAAANPKYKTIPGRYAEIHAIKKAQNNGNIDIAQFHLSTVSGFNISVEGVVLNGSSTVREIYSTHFSKAVQRSAAATQINIGTATLTPQEVDTFKDGGSPALSLTWSLQLDQTNKLVTLRAAVSGVTSSTVEVAVTVRMTGSSDSYIYPTNI